MGNTNTSHVKRDRLHSYSGETSHREPSSPKADDYRSFEFTGGGGTRRKLLLYQQSSEYSVDEPLCDEFKSRPRASTISQGATINENALPTVFKWEGGGKEVFITGTFSDWKPIKMVYSHEDFVAIVDVPEGTHKYKYIVDGNETVNRGAPLDDEKAKNVIDVKKSDFEVFEALAMDLAAHTGSQSQISPYSQEVPSSFKEEAENKSRSHGAGPPILPPHLLQVILNNPSVKSSDPTFLPQPNHVMLNHLYALSIKDGVMVLSCTNRYRRRYVTTLLHKPI
ncbi:5'-AMP-activated protein kinase subunit beta-1 isoform X2 [Brevipalpus obovatus]|uniref:5'-AMP-activated protein kinase subunit beta-1 isoform X2 n=1 Tax=Brevipalpus obovatus TaxID=246614 RepID=UPI003D9E7428